VIAGAVARAVGREAAAQRAADLGAVAGARVLQANYGRLFTPAVIDGEPNPQHLEKAEYLALGRTAALVAARANGATAITIEFPDQDSISPTRVRVEIREAIAIGKGKNRRRAKLKADAEAELGLATATSFASGGGYDGPLAYRQGKPMRPDVAQAFDRMEAAAAADGVQLIINSGFRSDAEQAVLWNRHPDPKWVARPGTSLHRNATELDLGPSSAYGWLAANAQRFHFLQRYSWEPWHYGYVLNAASNPGKAAAKRARRTGRCPGSCRRASLRCCAARRSVGTSRRSCSPPSCTPNRASTPSRSPRRAPRGSHSSCRAPPAAWALPTRSTPNRRSTPRRI
jgi:hypothetical protein